MLLTEFKPLSYAAFSIGIALSSYSNKMFMSASSLRTAQSMQFHHTSITQGCQRLSPKLIAPNIGTLTRSPLLPSLRYSVYGASSISIEAAIFIAVVKNVRLYL